LTIKGYIILGVLATFFVPFFAGFLSCRSL